MHTLLFGLFQALQEWKVPLKLRPYIRQQTTKDIKQFPPCITAPYITCIIITSGGVPYKQKPCTCTERTGPPLCSSKLQLMQTNCKFSNFFFYQASQLLFNLFAMVAICSSNRSNNIAKLVSININSYIKYFTLVKTKCKYMQFVAELLTMKFQQFPIESLLGHSIKNLHPPVHEVSSFLTPQKRNF